MHPAPPDREVAAPRALALLALAVLLGATLASYWPALDAGFVGYDDTSYIHNNAHVANGLRLEDVRWALTGYEQSNWHPLTWMSHMLDVELFGLTARGPHAVNLALHALNVMLLFALLRSLTGDDAPSLLVAALFALHPGNVESVAWIAQRKTLLCILFMLLAMCAYASFARDRSGRAYLASLAFFVLAMLSKPMVVTFPFMLLLLDFWPLRRREFVSEPGGVVRFASLVRGFLRLLPEKLPFLALAGIHALITLDAQRDAMSSLENLTLAQRLGNVSVAYLDYLRTYLWPSRLAVFYPFYPDKLSTPLVAGSAGLLLAATIASVAFGLRHRHLLVGWLWYVGTLVPVVGIVQVGMQARADRYVYVPYWGLSMIVAWSLHALLQRGAASRVPRAAAAAAGIAALAACAVLTHRQTERWHDAYTLFGSAIENTEDNYLAHSVLAERYYADGDFAKCIEHSREAVKFRRSMGAVRSTYGLALYGEGKRDEAREQFVLATEQEADNPLGFMNLGWFDVERGRYDLALFHLDAAAVRIKRGTLLYTQKMIFANWATALANTGRLEEARAKFEKALEIDSDNPDMLRDAARVDLQLGDPDRATLRLEQVAEADPGDADAAFLLASAAVLQGAESAALFAKAQAIDPQKAVVAVDLARRLAAAGRSDEALGLLDRVLALEPPADPTAARLVASTARSQRAEVLLQRGDAAGAIGELDRAVEIWPDNFDANNRLAFLLATSSDPALREPARAVALAERAVAARREYAALATLAAAYVSAGRLPAALDAAREGLALAQEASDEAAIAALQHQLALYSQMNQVNGGG